MCEEEKNESKGEVCNAAEEGRHLGCKKWSSWGHGADCGVDFDGALMHLGKMEERILKILSPRKKTPVTISKTKILFCP